MLNAELPDAVSSYLSAKDRSDPTRALQCFADDAIVWDQGEDQVLKGIAQIREWLEGPVAGYELTSEVTSGRQSGDDFVANVIVSGKFPASPYKFEYRFKVREGKIAELSIVPNGSVPE